MSIEQGAFHATLPDTLPGTLCFMSEAPVALTTTKTYPLPWSASLKVSSARIPSRMDAEILA